MPAPLDPALREAVETDIQAGNLSRNAIARKHNVAVGTVTRYARQLETNGQLDTPAAFDRTKVEAATRARAKDAAASRAALRDKLLTEAHSQYARLHAPCVWGNFGGKDNTYNFVDLDEPLFRDQATILGNIEKAVRTAGTLDDTGQASEQGKAAVLSLVDELRAHRDAEHDQADEQDAA